MPNHSPEESYHYEEELSRKIALRRHVTRGLSKTEKMERDTLVFGTLIGLCEEIHDPIMGNRIVKRMPRTEISTCIKGHDPIAGGI